MLKLSDRKLVLSWGDINEVVNELCERIPLDLPLVDSVYGIPRGVSSRCINIP